MPIATPFHPVTSRLCKSMRWKDWAGYHAVCTYEPHHDGEYVAFRHSCGLVDVSPLFKYDIRGKDAARFLSRVTVRDVQKLKEGRMTYLCWCDDEGKVIDDGTIARIGPDHYRVTAAEPSYGWFRKMDRGYDLSIEDVSTQLGALSLQGPTSRDLLVSCAEGDVAGLKYFGIMKSKIGGIDVWISRTGYTGDLGYELWVDGTNACDLYEKLLVAGTTYGMMPAGLDAMDVARVEAGFIMNGVDYFSAHHCMIEERKSSPYELGLGWCVELERDSFIGQAALRREVERGPNWQLAGLDIDWVETENLFGEYGLPPEVCSKAWRDGKPIYDLAGHWVGMATSGAWSPTLKKNLAIAQLRAPFGKEGTKVRFEMTVEYRRHTVSATVVKTPFFNPPRKRS